MDFEIIKKNIENHLRESIFCTFATANKKGEICACKMCIVNDGLKVYLQTDSSFEKVNNIKQNKNVAINCGAYYFKGIANILGHPKDYEFFIDKFKEKHPKSFQSYTNLKSEVLIEVKLLECKIWGYEKQDEKEVLLVVNLQDKSISKVICDKLV